MAVICEQAGLPPPKSAQRASGGERRLRPNRAIGSVGDVLPPNDHRRRPTRGITHAPADAGFVAAGGVAVAAAGAGPITAGAVVNGFVRSQLSLID